MPKMEALELPIDIMQSNPSHYTNKRIFVGTDNQSCLTAFNPLKRPKFGHIDSSGVFKKLYSTAQQQNQLLHIQWVPSHVGLVPNEEADSAATDYRDIFSLEAQRARSIHPATLKTLMLKQKVVCSKGNVDIVVTLPLCL